MNKKLRIIAAILSICALIALTACTAGGNTEQPSRADSAVSGQEGTNADIAETEDPTEPQATQKKELSAYQKFENISKTISVSPGQIEDSQADMDMEMTMVMTMDMMGQTMTMPMEITGNIKVISENGNIQYAAVMEMTDMMMTGQTSLIEMYFDGERGYYAMDGVEIEMNYDEIMAQISGTTSMPEFDEDAIKSIETSKIGDNEETTMIIDGQMLTDFIIEQMGDGFAELGEGAEMSVSDVLMIIVTTADEEPVSLYMEMVMNMIIGEPESGMDMNMDISMVMSYTFNKYGSGVEIDLSKLG